MERSIGDLWRNAEGGGAKQRSKRTVGELRRGVLGSRTKEGGGGNVEESGGWTDELTKERSWSG